MTGDTIKFRVGLFVLAGMVMLAAVLIVFGAGRLFRKHITVVTFFDESVQGLEPGSPVKWRGVRVGRVSGITLHSDARFVRVVMHIDRRRFASEAKGGDIAALFREKVRQGLRSRLELTGITGLKYVELDYYAKESPGMPQCVPAVPPGTICVPSVRSSLAQLEQSVTDTVQRISAVDFEGISQGIRDVLDRANRILGDPAIPESIADLRRSTAELAEVSERINAFADPRFLQELRDEITQTSRNVKKLTAQLQQAAGSGRLDRILTETETTVKKLGETIDDVRAELREADVAGLTREARGVLHRAGEAAEAAGRIRLDLRRTLSQADATLAALRALIQDLREDPSMVIRGRPEEESRQ